MLAYEPLLKVIKKYAGNPAPFLYTIILRFFLSAIVGFSALAIIFGAIFALSYTNLPAQFQLIIFSLVVLFALVFFAYFWAAFKGSMTNSMMSAEAGNVHMRLFLQYAFKHAPRYFSIMLVKNLVLLLANVPIILIIVFLNINLLSLPGVVLLLIALFITLAVTFAFFFSYVAAATNDLAALAAIRNSQRFIIKNPLRSLALFIFHCLVSVTLIIPILNILSLVTFYPVIYILIVDMYRSKF